MLFLLLMVKHFGFCFFFKRDASLARLLFSALFSGIFAKIEEEKTDREAAKLISDINQHLNAMISSSTQFHPPFVSCIQVKEISTAEIIRSHDALQYKMIKQA